MEDLEVIKKRLSDIEEALEKNEFEEFDKTACVIYNIAVLPLLQEIAEVRGVLKATVELNSKCRSKKYKLIGENTKLKQEIESFNNMTTNDFIKYKREINYNRKRRAKTK